MDSTTSTNPLGDFLQARRAELSPDTEGLTRRRVPGLRREEVATRAGVSVDYYTRIEQGRAGEVSDAVLGALAAALELDADQRTYLDAINRPATAGTPGPPPEVLSTLVDLVAAPAILLDARFDIRASNRAFRFLTTTEDAPSPRNMAEFVFLDPRSRVLISDWDLAARATIARLRHRVVSQHPQRLDQLVTVLARDSEWFATHWSDAQMRGILGGPGVLEHSAGSYRFDLVTLAAAPDSDLTLLVWLPADDSAHRFLRDQGWVAGPTSG